MASPVSPSLRKQLRFVVGRIEEAQATLLTQDHFIVDMPLSLLPGGVDIGTILDFTITRNVSAEKKKQVALHALKEEILKGIKDEEESQEVQPSP
eukprot:GILJ01012568.1.p1 GENE.GILJ01012568.1~~GILJ01012568.1.p1  ORF type:complete len:109 (-),score=22.36 GILJ01012568.1:289-573(-)